MFFIPGWLIAIVTFPGVIVHEFAHQLFCRLARVAVFDVCYFRVGNPAGYVVHEPPRLVGQNILIAVGPFFVNSLLGATIAAPGAIPVLEFGGFSPLDFFLVWLGVSIGMHAFPSIGDARSIWQSIAHEPVLSAAKLIGLPVVGLIFLGSLGSILWLDALYGAAVAFLLPKLLISLLA